MKLFNFKEFKENSTTEVTLEDYLTYLNGNRLELEDAMATAKELGLEETVGSELISKSEFIDKLLDIISSNKKDIVKQTIDQLSLEELQSLYEDKISLYNHDLQEAENKLKQINDKITEAEDDYKKKMEENGYVPSYYNQADTAKFFELPLTAHDYIKNIIEQDTFDEEELRQRMSVALYFEATKIGKTDDNVIKCMIDGIVNLFAKCHKLNKMLSDKSEYIVNSLLADNGISKVVTEFFNKDITDELFLDIQNIDREKNNFFITLPQAVQERLRNERFNGECYRGLFEYYYSLINETADEFKPFDTDELDSLLEAKRQQEEEIELISNSIELEKEFIQNRDKLREYLKSQIDIEDTDALTFTRLDNFVQLAQGGKEQDITRISQIDQEIEDNTNIINRLEEILDTELYTEEEEEKTSIPQSALLEPFVQAEAARYEQINMMINIERDLDNIKKNIHSLKKNKLMRAVSKTHKQSLTQYKREYNKRVLDAFLKLEDADLTLVEAPRLIVDQENGNVVITPSHNKLPANFDDLSYVAHSFWNLEEYSDEIIANGLATEEDLAKLVAIQKYCVPKLFDFTKDEDGLYQFGITDEERDILLQCQESIVLMARTLYQNRCKMDEQQKNAEVNLDEETINELMSMGFESISKEALQRKVFTLTQNNTQLRAEKEAIVAQCEDSMIEGINSLEEAIMYRDMLIGINECYVQTDEIASVLKMR